MRAVSDDDMIEAVEIDILMKETAASDAQRTRRCIRLHTVILEMPPAAHVPKAL